MRTTKNYRRYQRLYGPHFTKELCDFAISMMEDDKGPITPITKQQLEADYLGTAVPNNDYNLCMYVKKTIDDPDGYDGQPFNRWISDIEGMHVPVDWSEFV